MITLQDLELLEAAKDKECFVPTPEVLEALVEYARERAAREACEAAKPGGSAIWLYCNEYEGEVTYEALCIRLIPGSDPAKSDVYVQGFAPTLTAAYLVLRDKLEKR